MRSVKLLQEFKAALTIQALQQQVNHTITAKPQIPDQVIPGMHIVGNKFRLTAVKHFCSMVQQVTFKAATGNSFIHYLQNLRVEEAKR